jgi:MFS family permease
MNAAFSLFSRRPNYRRLFFANIISQLGDWLTYVAVSMLALEQGSGALAVAFVLIGHQLPQAILSPYAGAFADRFDRRKIMIYATRTQSALTVLMALSALANYLVLVQLFLVARMSLTAFFDTAESASIPRLVEKEEISLANALSGGAWSVTFATGVALGGVLSAFIGPIAAIAADAFTFFFASLLIAKLPAIEPERTGAPASGVFFELRAAWRYAEARAEVWSAVLAKGPIAFASGAAWVYLVQRSGHSTWLGAGAVTLGMMHAIRAIGTGLGPLGALSAENRGVTSRAILDGSAAVIFTGIVLFALSDGPGLAVPAVLLWGMGTGANWVKSTGMIQSLAADGYRGRLFSIDLLASAFGMAAGALLSAVALDSGAPPSFAPISGVFFAALFFFTLRVLARRLQNSLA